MIYGDIEGLREYATARGNTGPTEASDADAQSALQRGSDYILYHYANHLFCTVSDDTLEAAAYEAAIVELATPGFFTKTYTPSESKVLTEVKGIKWTLVGPSDGDSANLMPTSTIIEAMLGHCVSRNAGLGIRTIG